MYGLKTRRLAVLLLFIGPLLLLIVACGGNLAPESESPPEDFPSTNSGAGDPLATAAAQATAIVQQAQATALVLRAQSEAQATVQAIIPAPETTTGNTEAGVASPPVSTPSPTAEATAIIPIEVLSVGLAAEGGMIQVRFRAPVDVADRWFQGQVYLIDEASGREYKEIPVMPRIGPLFGKPAHDGQTGYFMLVNAPEPLQSGTIVTVVLGNHIEESIMIQ